MAKFSGPARPTLTVGPIRTVTDRPDAVTFEGGRGWTRDPKSELFVLAATNMVGEDTFYEKGHERDDRFRQLVRSVTQADPDWVARLVPYLRHTLQMRSASIVMVCEYVKAGGPGGRAVVNSACSRADEPAEVIGYWLANYGRALPQPIKRGVADAAIRLYNERAALKYDGQSRSIRMGDVVDLTHPKPSAPWQTALFRHLLDRRHNRPDGPPPILGTFAIDRELMEMPVEQRRSVLTPEGSIKLSAAGWTWERLSGWLPGGMDVAAWEAVIPAMGYMALLRNLRNFDQAGISAETRARLQAKLADPEEVARSRQFPYRFFSAYKHLDSVHWAPALEQAVEHSIRNIPQLPGRTLVLIDVSGSMHCGVSGQSKVMRWEVGALFGAAQSKAAQQADTVLFATNAAAAPVPPGASVLRYVEQVGRHMGRLGGGTYTHQAISQFYNGHDRVIVFTDEQSHDHYQADRMRIPNIHVVNLAGYKVATMPAGPGRYTYAGFTDAMFTMIELLERGDRADWPF